MPYVAMKLDDAPVVLVRITGRLTPEIHFSFSRDVADLIQQIPGTVYRINDLTGATIRLIDMAAVIAQASKGWAGTGSDPRVRTIVVFDHPNFFLGLAHVFRSSEWGRQIWVCKTVVEALALVRAEIVAQRSVEPGRIAL
jgi:hypothetical protein